MKYDVKISNLRPDGTIMLIPIENIPSFSHEILKFKILWLLYGCFLTGISISAFASVNLNEEFAITGVKVMEGSKGLFVAMPSYKTAAGYKDVCFPITKEARKEFNGAVLSAFDMAISQIQDKKPVAEEVPKQDQEMVM